MQRTLWVVCAVIVPTVALAQGTDPPPEDSPSPLTVATAPERNKALLMRFYDETCNKHNSAFADEIFAPNYIRHDGSNAAEGPGEAPLHSEVARDKQKYIGNLEFAYDVIVAEGDLVAVRWTTRADLVGVPCSYVGSLERGARLCRVELTFSASRIGRWRRSGTTGMT